MPDTTAPRVAELQAALDEWFDPRWAESWDAVGRVCGEPDAGVERVLLAVDAVPATVGQAIGIGAQLLVTHHPLLLAGVHGVPADDPKGGLVHRMIRAGVAHVVAHTNADVASPGVSDALAARVGLRDTTVLDPTDGEALDKLVVFVPVADAERLLDALAAAGAGRLGDYDRCAWTGDGVGTFRPGPGAQPAIGRSGEIAHVAEARLETVLQRRYRADVLAALRATHPYEKPAFDLLSQVALPSGRGLGRVGALAAPGPLAEVVDRIAGALPATAWGVRAAGDPQRVVRTLAVAGGACGSLAERARAAGADAFLTADLKHHTTLEAVTERGGGGMALIDAAHWATEAPWLDALAADLRQRFGTSLDVRVSGIVTDPWTVHASSPNSTPTSRSNGERSLT